MRPPIAPNDWPFPVNWVTHLLGNIIPLTFIYDFLFGQSVTTVMPDRQPEVFELSQRVRGWVLPRRYITQYSS